MPYHADKTAACKLRQRTGVLLLRLLPVIITISGDGHDCADRNVLDTSGPLSPSLLSSPS